MSPIPTRVKGRLRVFASLRFRLAARLESIADLGEIDFGRVKGLRTWVHLPDEFFLQISESNWRIVEEPGVDTIPVKDILNQPRFGIIPEGEMQLLLQNKTEQTGESCENLGFD